MKTAFLALALLAANLSAALAEPRVRAEIEATGPVLVGQQIRVNVTVLVPNYFLSSPQFPLFDIPGAVVTLPDENAVNGTERIDGETYAAITKTYLITAQQAGNFALPAVQITFKYAAEPGKPGVDGAVKLPPLNFTATLPAGASAAAPSLVAQVTVTQTLDGDPKSLKAGDALTRTVETFAANTQAMFIPPPDFNVPANIRIYPRDPVLTDVTSDRGVFVGGRRIDRVTYVFEQPGIYTLPAIEISWFNDKTGKQEVSSAPAISVTITPTSAAAPATEIAPPAPEKTPIADFISSGRGKVIIACSLALLALGVGVLWAWGQFWPQIRAWRHTRRLAWEDSEAAAFAQLKRACQAGDPARAYHALGLWARREGFGGLRILCGCEPALAREVGELEQRLYGGAPTLAPWNGAALFSATAKVRRSRQTANGSRRGTALPALNPFER
ncbi:MAG TPA: BatD family protein [Xanthobacteraceae bacterium]|jgi:hypothetical protein